jgi:hypothetical protein
MRRFVQTSVRGVVRISRGAACGRAVVPNVAIQARMASSLVSNFSQSVSSLPAREAVRYTEKNLKWTAEEFESFVNAHANALLEQGFAMGDVIGVWLPDSAEKHVTLMAAAKMGMEVVDFGNAIGSVEDLRAALGSAKNIKAIFFEPTNEAQDNLLLLRKAIPEFFHYDDTHGQPFHSKYYPSLSYFVHTGFDIEMGCLNYKSLFLHHPDTSYVDATAAATKDDTPLYSIGDKKMSHADVLKSENWGFAKKITAKEYFEL